VHSNRSHYTSEFLVDTLLSWTLLIETGFWFGHNYKCDLMASTKDQSYFTKKLMAILLSVRQEFKLQFVPTSSVLSSTSTFLVNRLLSWALSIETAWQQDLWLATSKSVMTRWLQLKINFYFTEWTIGIFPSKSAKFKLPFDPISSVLLQYFL